MVALAAALTPLLAAGAPGQDPARTAVPLPVRTDSSAVPYAVRRLADGVYAVPGDSGAGSEGRPNAGFVVTRAGVVLIDALGSPEQGERLRRSIARVSAAPVRWVILTHHHPDHHFGAIVFTRRGAKVIADPDRRTLASENGDSAFVAEWTRVVGERAMRGFAFADSPAVAVRRDTTLWIGGREIVLLRAPEAHTGADLAVWLPRDSVLFAGDLLVEDGVTLIADGGSRGMLAALGRLAALPARAVVPGHGAIGTDVGALLDRTRAYFDSARAAVREAVARGASMNAVLASMPPADPARPVARASRARRNAVRLYLEAERVAMGMDAADAAHAAPAPRLVSTDSLAALLARDSVTVVDARPDINLYLVGHLPGAAWLSSETLRSMRGGVPNLLLPAGSYATIFSRLGVRMDRPVVIYSAGESRDVDATYVAWILSGLGHPHVMVLDGGLAKWELESRPTTRRYPAAVPGDFVPATWAPERATLADVRGALGARGTVIVDARVRDQYVGDAGAQMRRGHIPGAVNHYWQDDLEKRQLALVWKPRATLRASYAAQGITPDRDVIVYCNGGLESSHVWFALRVLLGYPSVRVYDGSWTEWSGHEELPLERGPGAAAKGAH